MLGRVLEPPMSTRKRARGPDANDDQDELSPSNPTSAPLSAAKKRKLDSYGSKNKGSTMLTKFTSIFGFGGSEKENISGTEEQDELAAEDADSDDEKGECNSWEVPDEQESGSKTRRGKGKGKGLPNTAGRGTPISQGRGQTGSAKSERNGSIGASKKDIYEVDDSDEDTTVSKGAGAKQNVVRKPGVPKSASKVEKEEETGPPKRDRGRPSMDTDTFMSSLEKSPGRRRKSDLLKKAKSLSREAIFRQMVEDGRKAAEIPDEEKTSTRRRSARSNAEVEEDDDRDDAIGAAQTTAIAPRRPKNDAVESVRELPKGILTPTKDRTLTSRKSVAFEARDDIDLGFRDLPVSAKASKSKTEGRSRGLPQVDVDEPKTVVSRKRKALGAPMEDTAEPEEDGEDSDDELCAVCKRLESKKGNLIIFCDGCDFAAHQKCYDLHEIPDGKWFCRTCQPVENDEPCAVCKGLVSKKGNEIIICESCEFAAHQMCYGVSEIPGGEWLCKGCQPVENEDPLALEIDDAVGVDEVVNDLPEIEGLEDHLRHMQRVLLDRLTGQKRIKLRGHDDEMRKVHQVVEQTVLAGEGNSMLVIGARGCGKTTVSLSILRLSHTD